jgi:signal transduction histidine kinase/CheY-like chemotaxis protein
MNLLTTDRAPPDAFMGEDASDSRLSLRHWRADERLPHCEAELPPAIRSQLLDPAIWQPALQKFAVATNLAVALTDTRGQLLGQCLNPHPTWSLLKGRKPAGVHGCPFCLMPLVPCTCVTDALQKDGLVAAREATGLVHFAVPLGIGRLQLGALVGGQVFDHYPEQIPLQRLAKTFDLMPAKVWDMACREHPIKLETLRVYGDLLTTLGRTFLQAVYHTILEADRLAEMTRLRDLLQQRTQELIDADHRKDEFLALLAHELRNPLAPLSNAVQLMRQVGDDDPKQPWARDVVERQVQHLTRLVDDLLDVSRITRGKILLHKKPVDLSTVVNHAVEASRPIIEAHRHRLTVTLPPERVWVEADLIRLAQVMTNVLNNAAKYTEDGGQIGLTVEQEGEEVLLRVHDTGMGIAAEILPRIFEMFTQADQAPARSHGGLGIGLALVRSLVELHGGNVQAFSSGLGLGSEFVVRLPVVPEPRCRVEERGEEFDLGRPSPCRRVLVVDDNVDAARSLAMVLELSGHEVHLAHDGLVALTTAQDFQPQIVFLDIGLPGMDGYEVARRLRKNPLLDELLLVALSGYASEEDRVRSQNAGIDYHLVKPADPCALQMLLAAPESLRHQLKRMKMPRPA